MICTAKCIFNPQLHWQRFASIFFVYKGWSLTSRLYKSEICFYFPQFRQFYLKQSKLHNIFELATEDICGLRSVNCINNVQLGQNNIYKRKHHLKGKKKGKEIELTLISNEIRKRKIYIKEQESLLGLKFIRPVLLLTSRDSLLRFI